MNNTCTTALKIHANPGLAQSCFEQLDARKYSVDLIHIPCQSSEYECEDYKSPQVNSGMPVK